jgi:hypothetical protein
VSVRRDLALDRAQTEAAVAPPGHEWEMATDQLGTETRRATLLIQPGRRRVRREPGLERDPEMPPDPEPLPGDAPAVTDQLLHLLYDSRDNRASGFTATLHQWQDMAAIPARVPDGLRRLGFGGLGHYLDAAGEQIATLHEVSRLSFDGSWRYRIEHSGNAMVGDGRRCWQVLGDEWLAVPDGPPTEVVKLLDASGLLEHRLSGGAETTVDGRRGYRLRVTPDGSVPAKVSFADDVVADTELGILLRLIYHAGSTPVSRWELRDVVVGGDIHIDIRRRRWPRTTMIWPIRRG